MQDLENGALEYSPEALAAIRPAPTGAILSPSVLRRLARLQARAEGAIAVYQAAQGAAQTAQNALQEALEEACQDAGLRVPRGQQTPVDIDWATGHLTLRQETS